MKVVAHLRPRQREAMGNKTELHLRRDSLGNSKNNIMDSIKVTRLGVNSAPGVCVSIPAKEGHWIGGRGARVIRPLCFIIIYILS